MSAHVCGGGIGGEVLLLNVVFLVWFMKARLWKLHQTRNQSPYFPISVTEETRQTAMGTHGVMVLHAMRALNDDL
jgi:hypothetical protein